MTEPDKPEGEDDTATTAYEAEKRKFEAEQAKAFRIRMKTVMALTAHFVFKVFKEEVIISGFDAKEPPNPQTLPEPDDVATELYAKGFDHHVVVSFVFAVLCSLHKMGKDGTIINAKEDAAQVGLGCVAGHLLHWGYTKFEDEPAPAAAADGASSATGDNSSTAKKKKKQFEFLVPRPLPKDNATAEAEKEMGETALCEHHRKRMIELQTEARALVDGKKNSKKSLEAYDLVFLGKRSFVKTPTREFPEITARKARLGGLSKKRKSSEPPGKPKKAPRGGGGVGGK